MKTNVFLMIALSAGLLALALPSLGQQATTEGAQAEMSDVGIIAPAPYDLDPRITLSRADRSVLRKLEDKHLSELRSLEDHYAQELRALRAKQYGERAAVLKGFARK